MLAFFNHIQSVIRGYHKDKYTHLLTEYKQILYSEEYPSILKWNSWKHECKVDEVAYKLHPILFYCATRDKMCVPKYELFDSITYIIKYYPHTSEERFDCLDFLVDITTATFVSTEDKEIAATILNRFGTIDEQLYASRYLKENNWSERICETQPYEEREHTSYQISFLVHSALFSLPPTERETILSDLHTPSEEFLEFLSFYDIVEEIEDKLHISCTQEELIAYLFNLHND